MRYIITIQTSPNDLGLTTPDKISLLDADITNVCIIGYNETDNTVMFYQNSGSDEKLATLLIKLLDKPDAEIATWNGHGFLLPLLELKMLKNMIPCFHIIDSHSNARRWTNFHSRYSWSHLDLCALMSNFGASHKESLENVSKALNLPDTIPYDLENNTPELTRDRCVINTLNLFILYLKRLYVGQQIDLIVYKEVLTKLLNYPTIQGISENINNALLKIGVTNELSSGD